jgi:phosphate transport system protein
MDIKHTLKPFDRDLQTVRENIINMAEMASQELTDSLDAFAERNQDKAADVKREDVLINAAERIIDDLVIQTIVLHQPVASDCRLLIAALRIAKDLERIGDYATNIANHSATLDQLEKTGAEKTVLDMGSTVQKMMQDVLLAYSNTDAEAAKSIRQADEVVDKQYTQIFGDLLAISRTQAQHSAACTHLTIIARSLERIGDHITDIAEDILFMVEGKLPEGSRNKADTSASIK